MEIKDFWRRTRGGEFIAVMEYLITIKFFDYLEHPRKINSIISRFRFDKDKFGALLSFMISDGLVKMENDYISLSDFSRMYLIGSSEKYIGDFVLWKIKDFQNWRKNIGKVMTGKMSTVHGKYQYTDFTEKYPSCLEAITKVCALIYPSSEFAGLIRTKTVPGKLLDLGCGTGIWGFKTIEMNPKLSLICLDIETRTVKSILKKHYPGLINRTMITKKDMFKDRIPESENVLVASVFMDWEDALVKKLISKTVRESKCKRLFIYEFVLDDKTVSTHYNLMANIETRGRLRDKAWWREELQKHFKRVGFRRLDFGSYAIVCEN